MINGVSYNELGRIFEAVFNVKPAFNIPAPPSLRAAEQWAGRGGYPEAGARVPSVEESSAGKGWMGTPILFPFKMGGEKLKVYDQDGKLIDKEVAEFEMPAATLVDFSREKETIKTKVSGGYGTVKELFSFDDWSMKVRGLCLNEGVSGRTALEQREALLGLEKVADSIAVEGWLFSDTGIDRIIINSLTFRQVEGKPWVIPFELDCISDLAPELSILTGTQIRRVM